MRERPGGRLAHLPAMTQIVIGDDARHHGLADRHGANADAGVVAPLGGDLGLRPMAADGGAGIDEVGLTTKRQTTGCPVEMPPRMPPAWFERKIGLPSLPMRISSALSSPESAAAANPAPISTPLPALMPISAAARSPSSLP